MPLAVPLAMPQPARTKMGLPDARGRGPRGTGTSTEPPICMAAAYACVSHDVPSSQGGVLALEGPTLDNGSAALKTGLQESKG